MIKQESIERVLAATDIIELVGRYVDLKPAAQIPKVAARSIMRRPRASTFQKRNRSTNALAVVDRVMPSHS